MVCEVFAVAPSLGSSIGFTVTAGSVRAIAGGAGAAVDAGAAGALATGAALLPSLPGGQTKSSARPGGAGTGSPLTSTRLAVESLCKGWALLAPSSSSEFPGVTVSGTTGPATGRTADFASPGKGPTGPAGSATGRAIAHIAAYFALDIVRELAGA